MAVEFTYIHELQVEKMQLVHSLIDLNAERILSESRLAGIDIDTARCTEAIERGDVSEESGLELRQLEREREELLRDRTLIDENRESFELKIHEIEMKIVDLIDSSEQ